MKTKAILILDMPKTCGECPCLQQDDIICRALNEELFVNRDEEPIKSPRCPLKPMPKEKDGSFRWVGIDEADESYIHGWNDCLKELEK